MTAEFVNETDPPLIADAPLPSLPSVSGTVFFDTHPSSDAEPASSATTALS